MMRSVLAPAIAALLCLLPGSTSVAQRQEQFAPTTLRIFRAEPIRFAPDAGADGASHGIAVAESGRVIARKLRLPEPPGPFRVFARVATHPIPDGPLSVHDIWDRAGNVRIAREGMCDVEIVKFVTAYGGFTEHEVDVTLLAPLLRGECTIKGFVDTWTNPGWEMDFSLRYESAPETDAPDWALPLVFAESVRGDTPPSELRSRIEIPPGLGRVELRYLVSGHCTDGRGADEFVSKPNLVFIDGREAARLTPWREDCLQFRSINPYCKRWSDGNWSSDFSRSGWCPGDVVDPHRFELGESLPAGRHEIAFAIPGIRPADDAGQFGYWRVSALLVGWRN